MKRRLNLMLTVAALSVLGVAGTAFAIATIDPETGEGFVGKGDVQAALGWNNKQLQDRAKDLSFHYSDDLVVEGGSCINPRTGASHPNDVYRRTRGLDSAVQYDARVKNQITGFILTGFSSATGSTTYTDSCGGSRTEGPADVISVQPGEGLTVVYQSVSYPVPTT